MEQTLKEMAGAVNQYAGSAVAQIDAPEAWFKNNGTEAFRRSVRCLSGKLRGPREISTPQIERTEWFR